MADFSLSGFDSFGFKENSTAWTEIGWRRALTKGTTVKSADLSVFSYFYFGAFFYLGAILDDT